MSCVQLCRHATFVLLTLARTMTVIDNITILCSDVNKTSTSVELLAVNILLYMSQRSNVGLSMAGLKTFVEEWKRHNTFTLRIHSSLTNCFNKVIFLRFCNELKFHILSRDGKMFRLSPGIKISVLSKIGDSTFVLSTIDVYKVVCCSECFVDKTLYCWL